MGGNYAAAGAAAGITLGPFMAFAYLIGRSIAAAESASAQLPRSVQTAMSKTPHIA